MNTNFKVWTNLVSTLIVLACLQCKRDNAQYNRTEHPIEFKVNLNEKSKYPLDEIFQSINYLILSENEHIIGNIKQVLKSEHLLFILDDMNNVLLKYDDKGNYLKSLEGGGEGPEEIEEITWISANHSKKLLYVYSEPEGQVVKYNFDFEYLSQMPVKYFTQLVSFATEGRWLVFSNDTRQSGIDHNITIVDWNGNILDTFLPIDDRYERLSHELDGYTSLFKGETNIFLSYRYGIYSFDGEHLIHKHQINFGKSNILPEDVDGRYAEEVIEKLQKENKYIMDNYIELTNHIFFEANNFKDYLQVYISKTSGAPKVVQSFAYDKNIFGVPLEAWGDDRLVSFLTSEYANFLKSQPESSAPKITDEKLKRWISGETPGAILIIGKLKKW